MVGVGGFLAGVIHLSKEYKLPHTKHLAFPEYWKTEIDDIKMLRIPILWELHRVDHRVACRRWEETTLRVLANSISVTA